MLSCPRTGGKTAPLLRERSSIPLVEVPVLSTSPKVILLAKSETSTIRGRHVLVNSIGQGASPRKNDFASSPHKWYSPPRMKIRPGYFHVSIKSGQERNGIKIAIIPCIKGV
jgi:hypothetical protein